MANEDVSNFQRMGLAVADALRARMEIDEHGGVTADQAKNIRLEVVHRAKALLDAFELLNGKFFPDMDNLMSIMKLREFVRDCIFVLSVDRPICPNHLGNLLTELERLPILSPTAVSSSLLGPEFMGKTEQN
ncbi:hypothetical protein AUJ46_01710 [Candidatus Peregrinibacteria bacterium CG1_02_54_53]|nr:MAG: hypothetical protein AUJ46_01710 [Candidatus Peregrinibacteria bacterium CG1_02_54_53]